MSQFESPTPAVPPQYPGPIPTQASAWPTVIGTILIVIASLGLLFNVCGGVMSTIMPAIMSKVAESSPQANDAVFQAQIAVMQKYMGWSIINALVMLALSVIMLMGGIGIVRRRRSGVTMSRLWAVLRIIWAIPASYVGYVVSMETFKAMEQASADSGQTGMPAGVMGFMQGLGVIGVIIGFVIVCLLPGFILIWFALPKIKAEVATWR